MTRGPIPKPTALKKAEGIFRPDKHGPVDHPFDEIRGTPEKPHGMPEHADAMWDHMVRVFQPIGVVTEIDAYQLEILCLSWAKFRELAYRAVHESYDDEQCARIERRLNNAYARFDKCAAQFGISPSARARLRAAGNTSSADVEGNVLDEFGIVG